MHPSDAPGIALIVPVLNEAAGLPGLFDMLAQCGAEQCLIVDGGSVDGSAALLEQSGIRWMTANAGRASQMNAGAAVADADILLFLHADTILDASHLMAVREVMRRGNLMERGDVVGGRFDVRLSGPHAVLRVIEWFINLRSRISRISTGDQAMFVRRDVFIRMGGFADIPLMEDVEFSRRLKLHGKIACLSQRVITSSRRWERHGILATVLLMWRLRLMFWLGVPAEKLAAIYRQAR